MDRLGPKFTLKLTKNTKSFNKDLTGWCVSFIRSMQIILIDTRLLSQLLINLNANTERAMGFVGKIWEFKSHSNLSIFIFVLYALLSPDK